HRKPGVVGLGSLAAFVPTILDAEMLHALDDRVGRDDVGVVEIAIGIVLLLGEDAAGIVGEVPDPQTVDMGILVVLRQVELDLRPGDAVVADEIRAAMVRDAAQARVGKLLQDPNKIASNLNTYIGAFSPGATEVLEKYGFPDKLKKLEEQGLLANTRVVYTSDHGDNLGTRGLWGKSTMYEESAGIPMIAAGPGIPAPLTGVCLSAKP
uniref:sulfatase-like hydrolase/transferase n=1 Tax=Undibacterium luofuense TaxID=2828733 RepID=UPI0030EC9346